MSGTFPQLACRQHRVVVHVVVAVAVAVAVVVVVAVVVCARAWGSFSISCMQGGLGGYPLFTGWGIDWVGVGVGGEGLCWQRSC